MNFPIKLNSLGKQQMKDKLNKHKKSETRLNPKMTMKTNSEDNNTNTDSSNNTANTETNQQQNNTYPDDIQGLFERLGIA